MFGSALLFAALLPQAHATEPLSLSYSEIEIEYSTRSMGLPEALAIAFSAPDSRTVEIHVAAEDDEFQSFAFTYGEPEFDDAREWWALCLAGKCPTIEVGTNESNLTYSGESGGLNESASDVEWRYVSIRRYPTIK